MPKLRRLALRTLPVCVCLALSACANHRPAPLYQWQNYQADVDSYFRSDKLSPDAQTLQMEEGLQKIEASGAKAPPGYHAHLGLLYGQQGRSDLFVQQIEAEKQEFPESETFMDFLLRNFKK
jgi:hypothetical protein